MSPTSRAWSWTLGRRPCARRAGRRRRPGAGGWRQRRRARWPAPASGRTGPAPVKVPTGEDHSKVRRSTAVSASVTVAVTTISSPASARLAGSRRRRALSGQAGRRPAPCSGLARRSRGWGRDNDDRVSAAEEPASARPGCRRSPPGSGRRRVQGSPEIRESGYPQGRRSPPAGRWPAQPYSTAQTCPTPVGTYKLSVCVGSLGLACRTAPFGRPRRGGWGTWVITAVERDSGASARADDRRLKVCAEWSLAWWGVAKW